MTHVDLRPLGSTGIQASPITLGTSYLGANTEPGSAEESAAVDLANALLSGPYALVDTSNAYAGGRSEAILGLASGPADVVTKTDRDLSGGVFNADRVVRSFEESCERLGVEHVRILHLHDPYTITFEEASAPGGAIEGMTNLKERGLVDAIGIAAGRNSTVKSFVLSDAFDVVLTHNRFTLVDQSAVPILEAAHERGMGVFNAAPFGGKLLAKGAASLEKYAYQPSPPELLAWVARVERICAEHGTDLPTVALHFSLRSPLVHSTVVGVSSPERLAQLEATRTATVPAEVWEAIAALGPAPSPITD